VFKRKAIIKKGTYIIRTIHINRPDGIYSRSQIGNGGIYNIIII